MLRLKFGGTALSKSMVPQIKIKANGKVIVEGTATELDKLNAYRGETTDPLYLDIQFADYKMITELDRQVGAFDTTQGILSLTTEVTTAGATAPTITPILIESAQQNSANGGPAPFAGLISKVLKYPYNIATGGRLPITVPFGPQNGSIIKRLHVLHGGNMTAATVKQDGIVIHESMRLENEFDQKKNGRVPQANMYTIDFVVDGNVKKALDTRDARSLEWIFDFAAADSGNVIVEYLDPLGNL
jgi:hypothetical protein